jgi:hypothetical protein
MVKVLQSVGPHINCSELWLEGYEVEQRQHGQLVVLQVEGCEVARRTKHSSGKLSELIV